MKWSIFGAFWGFAKRRFPKRGFGFKAALAITAAALLVYTAHIKTPISQGRQSPSSPAIPRNPSSRSASPHQCPSPNTPCANGNSERSSGADPASRPSGCKNGLYGYLTEAELPWANREPPRLKELRARHHSRQLVAAFCATLIEPLMEEEHNVSLAARLLAGTVVKPGEVLSLNRILGPYTKERGYRDGPSYAGMEILPSIGGGVCKLASTLYNTVVAANLQVVERHNHTMLVPYVPPGRDATIAEGTKDFRFRNTADKDVVIWAEKVDKSLFMALYGDFVPPRVEWHHKHLARQKTWKVRRFNPKLGPGEERVVIKGEDGVTVRTWVIIRHPDRIEHREMGIDHYFPMPTVIEFGPR